MDAFPGCVGAHHKEGLRANQNPSVSKAHAKSARPVDERCATKARK
jgi:hypothetical protein